MPHAAPRPCTQPGCPAMATKSGRCEDHPRKAWATTTTSSHSRGYGWSWQKKRARILKRDNYLCIPCREQGAMTAATEVDHRISKARGGTEDDYNLQSICEDCHKVKTANER